MSTRRPSIGGGIQYLPIKTLNSYASRWKIRARVMDITPVTTFTRKQGSGGSGQIFTCVLMDNEGTTINCKFWNSAAQKYSEILEKGKIYSFSKGKIGVSNKRFAGGVPHNYEISYDTSDADITPIDDDDDDEQEIPETRNIIYSSLRSVELATTRLPFTTNVIGIPHGFRPIRQVQTKNGDTLLVRNIVLVDATEYSMEVSLWGSVAEAATDDILSNKRPIAIEHLQIREGRLGTGRVGSTTRMSNVEFDKMDLTEAKELDSWYREHGDMTTYKSLSAENETLGGGTPPITATIKGIDDKIKQGIDESIMFKTAAYVSRILYTNPREDNKVNVLYPACVKCSRKVTDDYCQNCSENVGTTPRLAFSVVLDDHTAGGLVVRVFNDVAQTLLQVSAKKIEDLIAANNMNAIREIFEYKCCWRRFALVIRTRKDFYQSELRVNLTLGSATPITPNLLGTMAMQKLMNLIPNVFDAASIKRACETNTDDTSKIKLQKINQDNAEEVNQNVTALKTTECSN